MNNQLLEKKLNGLPEDLKKEALDFIDFLIIKNHQYIENEKFEWFDNYPQNSVFEYPCL